jgi:hypothetical protein
VFRSQYLEGPLDGQAADLGAPIVPTLLFFAPAPDGVPLSTTIGGWLLIGYDKLPAQRFPDVVTYRLDRESSSLRPHPRYDGMELGTAVYVLEA